MTVKKSRIAFHCPKCGGTGRVLVRGAAERGKWREVTVPCPRCAGTLRISVPGGRDVEISVEGTDASEVQAVLSSMVERAYGDNLVSTAGDQTRTVADVAILTALDKELEAVVRHGGPWKREEDVGSIRTCFRASTEAGLSVVAARASGMGQLNAALLARDIVERWRPSKVLLVGIAGGLSEEVALGDIVVSDQIVDYELGKVMASGAHPRWSVYRSDSLLRERLVDFRDSSWHSTITAIRPDGKSTVWPMVHSGVVLSGNKVIANKETAGALISVWTRAAAIEMEAAGIAAALHQLKDGPAFVMVKSICDRADSGKDDRWQEYAADVAAAFVDSFIFGRLQRPDTAHIRKERPLPAATTSIDFRALRLALSAAFDLRELKILMSDLGVDWDNIAGSVKDEKIVELLWYMSRRQRLSELLQMVRADRPGLLEAYFPSDGGGT